MYVCLCKCMNEWVFLDVLLFTEIFYYAYSVRYGGDGGIFPFVPNNNLNRFSLCKSMSENWIIGLYYDVMKLLCVLFYINFFFFSRVKFTTLSYSIETAHAPNSWIANLKVEKKNCKLLHIERNVCNFIDKINSKENRERFYFCFSLPVWLCLPICEWVWSVDAVHAIEECRKIIVSTLPSNNKKPSHHCIRISVRCCNGKYIAQLQIKWIGSEAIFTHSSFSVEYYSDVGSLVLIPHLSLSSALIIVVVAVVFQFYFCSVSVRRKCDFLPERTWTSMNIEHTHSPFHTSAATIHT